MSEKTTMVPQKTIPGRPAALIIGVNHYNDFDESVGMVPGFSNLQGSINDAKVYYNLARRRGAPPQNIMVITSAPVSAEFLGEGAENAIRIADARAKVINDGISWMLEHLSHGDHPVGFIAFSGHGDYLEEEEMLVLCAQDTQAWWDAESKKLLLKNIVRMRDIREQFSKLKEINLTYFLDVCYASGEFQSSLLVNNPVYDTLINSAKGSKEQQQQQGPSFQPRAFAKLPNPHYAPRVDPILLTRSRCLTRRPLLTRPNFAKDTPEVLLIAADLGKPSYEFNFNGVWNGAFTRVIQDILDRWDHPEDSGAANFYITNEELLHRADLMLRAMNFDQTPTFVGIDSLRNNRVLARENSEARFTGPVRAARRHELDPDLGGLGFRLYLLEKWEDSIWKPNGWVISVGTENVRVNNVPLVANRSYWAWNTYPFGGTYALRPSADSPLPTSFSVVKSVYSEQAFGDTKADFTVRVSHDIRLNLVNAPVIGELVVGPTNTVMTQAAAPSSLSYFMKDEAAQVPPYFDVAEGDRLVFTALQPTVKSFRGWTVVDNRIP